MKRQIVADSRYGNKNPGLYYDRLFWSLHDRDMETGLELEKIISDFCWDDLFFPEDGEPTATEEDYRAVLQEIDADLDIEDVIESIMSEMQGIRGISNISYEESIKAIRFTLGNGIKYQLVVQELGR